MLKFSTLSVILFLSFFCHTFLFGDVKGRKQNTNFEFQKQKSPESILTIDGKKLDINRISAWLRNNGEFYSDYSTQTAGFEWPKGSGINAVFSSAMWIGAKVKNPTDTTKKEIRVATVGEFGSEYRPGRILPGGRPENYTLPNLRIYQVRPLLDSPTTNVDYAEWPVDQGAPWIDINSNGIWEPNVDKIGIMFPKGPRSIPT